VIVDDINDHRHLYGVDPICRVLTEHGLEIAPSTYYAAKQRGRVSDTALAEAYAANTVRTVYVANRRLYGVRKMWHAMKRAGHDVGRDEVSRLMGICDAVGVGAPAGARSPPDATIGRLGIEDLIDRQWDLPARPDQWWVADFTYTWTLAGFVYTSLVVDVFSRGHGFVSPVVPPPAGTFAW
jgi:transposase InsO family protein